MAMKVIKVDDKGGEAVRLTPANAYYAASWAGGTVLNSAGSIVVPTGDGRVEVTPGKYIVRTNNGYKMEVLSPRAFEKAYGTKKED